MTNIIVDELDLGFSILYVFVCFLPLIGMQNFTNIFPPKCHIITELKWEQHLKGYLLWQQSIICAFFSIVYIECVKMAWSA